MAESSDDPLRLANQVCFPLYAATNLLQRLYRPLLAPLGLTYSQYLVMLILWERAPVTVGEIGSCLHLDNGTLTPLLKRMERGGFITRSRDPRDERRVLVAPTPQGLELRTQALRIPEDLAQRIALGTGEIDTLRNSVVSLVHHLADDLDRGKEGSGGAEAR
ncbi:MarR family winged helix-turn-helix transcriptional regulator [Chachezhania sediminis]|uniref:MarR family winged helix-turn-helix transcriptional regulator n=1 Tax=Chachezhania sediminis TaxID=2599291 RepID=UPI00131AA85F|nr:MarR family transcriptional regulator [Chachezhania sediminis]